MVDVSESKMTRTTRAERFSLANYHHVEVVGSSLEICLSCMVENNRKLI